MKKLCKYPVRKWKDIPLKTRERIRKELAVRLPKHLKRMPLSFKIREKKKSYLPSLMIAWGGLILLILISLLLILN
jgi:hypothetical protein